MFAFLRAKPRILITGPLRSGSTICTKIIAHDTGYPCLLEEETLGEIPKSPLVMQAPYLLELVDGMSDWYVVFMERDLEPMSLSAYKMLRTLAPSISFEAVRDYTIGKQIETRAMQKRIPHRSMMVKYEELKGHSLWREDRRGWHLRQTENVDSRTTTR